MEFDSIRAEHVQRRRVSQSASTQQAARDRHSGEQAGVCRVVHRERHESRQFSLLRSSLLPLQLQKSNHNPCFLFLKRLLNNIFADCFFDKIHLESKRAPFFELIKSEYTISQESYFITFKKIKTFLKENTLEEVSFDFLPIDLHFCLHQDAGVLMQIKTFLYEKYEKENLRPLVIEHESDGNFLKLCTYYSPK